MAQTRTPGSEIKMKVENGDYEATLRSAADLMRADLEILGDDYIATFKDNEDGTVSAWCEMRYPLRSAFQG